MASAGLAATASLVASFSAGAHEDWRKLRDAQQAVSAPMWSLSQQARMQDDGPGVDDPSTMFESHNVTLLAWIPLSAFPGGHGAGNDCWGYTSPSGREYAIMCLQKGFGYVEVTDPTNPLIVDWVEGPASTWRDVKVIGHYAYGVSEGGAGIQVMDLSEIDEGRVRLVRNKTQLGHRTTHNIVANEDSGYLYLVGANIANGGLIAVSLDDPENPLIVGQWSTHYVHDAQVVTYHDGPYAGREIAFCCNGIDGLEIIDVTDKDNMFLVGRSDYPGLAYTHQAWLSEDRRYLYLNDELDESSATRVFDVSDITNPHLVSTFTSGLPAIDHNNYVRGTTLYQANYRSGLRVFDLSDDPTQPVQIAWFDTFPGSVSAAFNGAWSTYPYFGSGVVLISDIQRGLFIVDVHGDGAAKLEMRVPGGAPTEVRPYGQGLTVEVNELAGVLGDGGVQMNVRLPDGQVLTTPMSPAGDGLFEGTLPALPCFETIEYWFEATADDGRLFRAPLSAPFVNFQALVVTEIEVVVSDDFETDAGWTVENIEVDEGPWERGVPRGRGTRGDPRQDYDGSGSLWTTGLARNEDLDGGPTRLTTTTYDLTGVGPEARIRFAAWFTNSNQDEDRLDIEMSDDEGLTWTLVESIAGMPSEWKVKTYRVADFVTVNDRFKMRFSATDNPNNSVTEAAIDAFQILRMTCNACRADMNGDGSLDIFDFLEFQSAFALGEARADFDGDGQLTIFDFLAFQTAFALGCE